MIVLYTTHCPKCRVLEKKLGEKNIQYVAKSDVTEMTKLGIKSAPVLDIDGDMLDFGKAVKWVNNA